MLEYKASIRLSNDLAKKAKRVAKQKGYTLNGLINRTLSEAVGIVFDYPVIVCDGDDYYWLSPFGKYGDVNKTLFNRFIRGSIPMAGDDWDDLYDDYNSACKDLGKTICRYVEAGLVVDDVDGFIKLYNAMNNRKV